MIAVIGGGIVGLSTAWELSRLGQAVTVVDAAGFGGGASGAATAYLEPRFGVSERHRLERHALEIWPKWAAALEAASGLNVGLRTEGQIRIAPFDDAGDQTSRFAAEMADRRDGHGWDVAALSGNQARAMEPWLARGIARAAHLRDVRWVDGRAVCAALVEALRQAGATLLEDWPVERIGPDGTLHRADGEALAAKTVLIANGMGANALGGLPDDVPACRPVRGVNLVLDVTGMADAPRHLIKHHRGTICPRSEGARETLLVGTTYENNIGHLDVAAEVVERIYANAEPVMPNVRALPLLRVEAGLRVKVGNGLLSLGRSRSNRHVCWSLGHAGAAFLRAPYVAPCMARFMADGSVDPRIADVLSS